MIETPSISPLLSRFAGDCFLADRSKVTEIVGNLQSFAALPHAQEMMAETAASADGFWPEPTSWKAAYRPYTVVDGILHIPVQGVLMHNFPWATGYATGYDYIWRAFERGCEDYAAGNIKGIALKAHTPGGMVAGCFDMTDRMEAAKAASGVPVRAFAHEYAYSAGYATICIADSIAVSRTGGVGSIGVVTSHTDWSKWNENFGIDITYLFKGKHKVDGNPDEPLSEASKNAILARLAVPYDIFVSTVARNRKLDEQAVRNTEAACFTPSEAVSNGLADSIGSLDDAVAAFVADLSSDEGDEEMSTQDNTTAVDQAAIEAAVAAARPGILAEGAAAERTRINAILALPEAANRPKAANAIAMTRADSVEEAQTFLAALPEESAAVLTTTEEPHGSADTPFNQAMSNGNPEVGGGKPGGGETEAKDDGSDVVALMASTGFGRLREQASA